MTTEPFADLIRRACRRDPEAAAELVRSHEPELRRFIRFRLTDPELRRFLDSLDICQSVLAAFFVQLCAGELTLTSPRQLSCLLAVMAQNKLIDQVRRQRAERRGGGLLEASRRELPEDLPDDRPEPWLTAAGRELLQLVIAHLTEEERDLLKHWMVGEGWEEIASARDGSPEALRKRLSRAIDRAAREIGLLEETS
jgi:RNA polymerase sigma-70 factor (ECF subfamily)